jgi:membrane protein DedA with SNARE-associated domain
VGTSRVKISRFIFLNVIGAILWAITVSLGGFLFGEALERILGHANHYKYVALIALTCLFILIWIGRHIHLRSRRGKMPPPAESAAVPPEAPSKPDASETEEHD